MALNEQQLKHLKTWQASGLSQTFYCQVNGLNKNTFSEWFTTYKALPQYIAPALIALKLTPLFTWLKTVSAPELPEYSRLKRA